MEFEEGEVDDLSDSDGLVISDNDADNDKHSEMIPVENIQNRHHGRKSEKSRRAEKRRRKSFDKTSNREVFSGRQSRQSKQIEQQRIDSLTALVSDDDVDFHVATSENTSKHRSIDGRRLKKKKRKERVYKPLKQANCRYYMEGRCHKGGECSFGHDLAPSRKQDLCKFYAVGTCSKGSSCLYMHEDFPCKFFHLSGNCSHGAECKFSHAPLTPISKVLLERVLSTKDATSIDDWASELSHGSNYQSSCDENGDIDYRFGRPPPATPSVYLPQPPYETRFPPRNPFFPPPNTNQSSVGLRPNMHTVCRPDTRGRFFHGEMPPRSFLHGNGILNPGPPYREPVPPMRMDMRFHRAEPLMMFRPPLNPPCAPRYNRPRPPFQHPPNFPPRVQRPYAPGFQPTSEDILGPQLDQMAALLASSKPPPARSNIQGSPTVDVHPYSPDLSKETNECPQSNNGTDDDPGHITQTNDDASTKPPTDSARDTSSLLSSPESSTTRINPSPPTTIPWRLIPLDMNVKIPYPLMQLQVSNLATRFEDPRLRGHFSALRPYPQLIPPLVGQDEIITEEAQMVAEPEVTKLEEVKPPAPISRRPVKLQLNEMANTFANTKTVLPVRSGDRSYLDDPRFRRRRIVNPTVTTSPVEAQVVESLPANI